MYVRIFKLRPCNLGTIIDVLHACWVISRILLCMHARFVGWNPGEKKEGKELIKFRKNARSPLLLEAKFGDTFSRLPQKFSTLINCILCYLGRLYSYSWVDLWMYEDTLELEATI